MRRPLACAYAFEGDFSDDRSDRPAAGPPAVRSPDATRRRAWYPRTCDCTVVAAALARIAKPIPPSPSFLARGGDGLSLEDGDSEDSCAAALSALSAFASRIPRERERVVGFASLARSSAFSRFACFCVAEKASIVAASLRATSLSASASLASSFALASAADFLSAICRLISSALWG
eukprot:23761-Pelagococcus_subviridis.AAC.5